MNPLREIENLGQSLWLDYIRRKLLESGEMNRLIDEDGIKGMTSNPAIFHKAIAGSDDYAEQIAELAPDLDLDDKALYERLAFDDVRTACDLLAPVHRATRGADGFVSIEVDPGLAYDTDGTVEEARRIWRAIDRPNLMIKVPATEEGLPAIEQLLAEGVNVNVTLLFAVPMYQRVVERYLRALERRLESGADPGAVASVASFFVSRVDTAVDALLEARIERAADAAERAALEGLLGKAAVANAKRAYQRYRELFAGERWNRLAAEGARTQRLLWASTSTKDPRYSDVKYVEELIGPETVNTVPPATLAAFRDHGRPRPSLLEDVEQAEWDLEALARHGIDLGAITDRLLREGVEKFIQAFDKLLAAVEAAREAALDRSRFLPEHDLPESLRARVEAAIEDWTRNDKVQRLWNRDADLWTGDGEPRWMDWLDIACEQMRELPELKRLAHMTEGGFFRDAVLMGMGGSSMAPEVFSRVLGDAPDHPRLHVLDSTDPAHVRAVERAVDPERTAFLVASKSGSTLEPNILMDYFWARAVDRMGPKTAAAHFGAITDPGSHLERVARERGFRKVFYGEPGIGGRFSALSAFGLVPAALTGADVERLLDRAGEMVEACAACVPPAENPGVLLGLILGTAAVAGRDKLTLVASPGVAAFGAWLEQLVAESTGKQGKAVIPVDGEPLQEPDRYGQDRLFVYLRLRDAADPGQDRAVDRLRAAGHPVVILHMETPLEIGAEMYRWEIATAVAGSILQINPFDQPDVEASKIETRRLTAAYEETGELPAPGRLAGDEALWLYTDEVNRAALREAAAWDSVEGWLRAHLERIGPGDYFALLAYLNRLDPAIDPLLQRIRRAVLMRYRVATCLGYGPRFLHSTGQAYKGGPNTGVFLQITAEPAEDLPVPGRRYTFGVVEKAQAFGDFNVLCQRGRRALGVHLGGDVQTGLQRLTETIEKLTAP
jgi:transaldolase/glucose-6-phosphate isomerase